MKIQKKFTTAARGMMAMKKDVAKDVMANLAENGTMFDKDKVKGKVGKMESPKPPKKKPTIRERAIKGKGIERAGQSPKKPKRNIELFPKDDPIFEGGKFIQREDGFIIRNPDYRRPPRKGAKGMKYENGGKAQDGKLSKLKSELDKVNDEIEAVMKTKDVSTLMDEKAKKVAERRGLSRIEIIESYLSPLQDKKDSLQNEISKIKKGAKGMKYSKAKGGMKVQYKMMQEGGKNPIAKDEDYTLMYKVDDQKMSGGRKIPETKVTGEEIKNLFVRNKILPSEERYFQSQLKELGISEPIKNLVTSGRLESEIKKAKKSLAEKEAKDFKKEMMEQVNKPSQDRLKSGEKGMKYQKGPGGMVIKFVKKNK